MTFWVPVASTSAIRSNPRLDSDEPTCIETYGRKKFVLLAIEFKRKKPPATEVITTASSFEIKLQLLVARHIQNAFLILEWAIKVSLN
jgi:hypothetical protein